MLARHRHPDECRWREQLDPSSAATCRLVEQLATPGGAAAASVGRDLCLACCRSTEPVVTSPGEAVASRAHELLEERMRQTVDAAEFVRAAEQLVWVEQFLGSGAGTGGPAAEVRRGNDSTTVARFGRGLRKGLRRRPRLGLVGTNNLKGLGHMNRDLVRQLAIDDWLIPGPPAHGASKLAGRPVFSEALTATSTPVDRFLDRIDVLLFVERPHVEGLTREARRRSVRTVCVPLWEWIHPGLQWLHDVDLMLCPTRHSARILDDWKSRYGFTWDTCDFPWPIDVASIPSRLRTKCRRFVTIHGAPSDARRKGLDILLDAARRLPDVPFLLWSQTGELPELPENVAARFSATSHRELYEEGDVCVQLSRWEGLGLPLLECQAAGLPLITTDAAPMNEHNPAALVPVAGWETIELWHRRPIPVPVVRGEDAASLLRSWVGRDIEQASRAARAFVEREHSWTASRAKLRAVLSRCFQGRP